MKLKSALMSFAAVAVMSVGVQAAEEHFKLVDVSGKVLIQTQSGFKPVVSEQLVSTGSRVFVGQEATATLVNSNGSCNAPLPAGQVTLIDPAVVCGSGPTITPVAYEGVPGEIPPPIIVGAFVAVLAAAVFYAAADEEDKPVSAQ